MPESKVELLKEISSRDERAIENLSICLAGFSLNFAYGDCIQSLTDRADYSRDTSEKLELLDRAIELGREGMKYLGLNTLQPEVPWRLAVALHGKANLAGSKVERERLHSEAVSAVRGDLESMKRLIDPGSWNIGITSGRLGTALRHLSDDQEHSSQERQAHLEESAHYLALAVETTSKAAGAQTKSRMQRIGAIAEELGNTMQELSSLTGKREDALRTAKAFEQAIAYYSVQSLNGLMAPLEWKVAKIYDSIEDYDYSSNAFRRAGEQYETAAKGQKSLQKEFTELSYYMQAWSNIEEARVLHKDEDYLSSADKLKGSSKLLERTDSFRYLSEFYLASSKVEEAEDLSRKEKSEEAAEAFGAAAELYGQAEKNAASHGESGGSAGLSRSRQGYCLARRSLEEAKVLDMAGQAQASMRKYRQAAEAFGRLESETRGEDKGELEALSLSCVAWATMKEGEYSSSSELYYRAAQLFLEAKEKKVRQSFVLSCLANASMCEALAAGTNFKRSSDVNLYSEIKTKLGAASRYYEEAGFEIASDWTRATEALFDSLAYLAGAEREIDPQKKTQMYQLAEKHLELSARRYGDIGFDKKRQEVLRHLKTARENRELLLTPIEALSQSPTVAATPVTFTRDQAVGLERFEAAKLTGSFGVSATSSDIGSELRLDIDFANVGKAPALLMKLNNVAPSDAFEPEEGKNTLQFSTGAGTLSIDLKGRRLEYLKAHQVSIYLKAKSKGTFELSPKVVFVDEMGKYRSFDYEPQAVVIGEPPGQPQQGERRLAAIMFTDMVGYTALTQSNESLAMEVLQRHNRLIRPFFPRFHGREVKTIGDSFLAEFDSALDALKCAVELQSFLHDYNISSRDEWRIKLRVGIHLGDVIHQQGDVLGDAVNIASRIEPTAEPEGVCVSAQVYDQVHNKFERPLVSLGERTLKNVSGDVEVFKVMMPWE